MPITGSPIYLSTLLLEKNRSNGKGPSLLVSDWMEPIGEAGFSGLEIWMNHLLFSSRSEWELIKDRGQEADLATVVISSALPGDGSDKSQRLREAILEACEYFRPEFLKVAPPRGEPALDFLSTWSQDLPREIGILVDNPEGEGGIEGLDRLRKALPGGRFQAVIHPFLMPAKDFGKALETYGDFIANLGVRNRKDAKGGDWALLSDTQDASLAIIAAAGKGGFKGSWTLELTKGVGRPGENIDDLFDHAEADLNFLDEFLAQGKKPG